MKRAVDRNRLRFWDDKEIRLQAAHILDLVDTVLKGKPKQVTLFLSFAMREWAEDVLRHEQLSFLAEGGFPEAERVRILMSQWGEELDPTEAEISMLWVQSMDARVQLEHRQVLGSLLALGFERDVLGDIQRGQSGFYVATTAEIAPFIMNNWTQVGREKIEVSRFKEKPMVTLDQGEERRITVNTSRIDAVIANAFRVSRSSAQGWITQGKVRRDGVVVSKAESVVQPDEMISCRGYGRIKLLECSSTRKDRSAWRLVLYQSQRH